MLASMGKWNAVPTGNQPRWKYRQTQQRVICVLQGVPSAVQIHTVLVLLSYSPHVQGNCDDALVTTTEGGLTETFVVQCSTSKYFSVVSRCTPSAAEAVVGEKKQSSSEDVLM